MQVTPNHDLPYPDQSDSIDVAGDISALALAVDGALSSAGGKVVGEIFAWWDIDLSKPPPTGTLRCDGQVFNTVDFPALGELLGSNTAPDLRGRFLRMGDDAFPNTTKAGTANAIPVTHSHSTAAHTHSIPNHAHTMPSHKHTMGTHTHSINHNHGAAFTSTDGAHAHDTIENNYGADSQVAGYVSSPGWIALNGLSIRGGQTYERGVTSKGSSHKHSFDMPSFTGTSGATDPGDTSNTDPGDTNSKTGLNANSGGGGSSGSAGSSGTNANLPPFISVTYLIQAI